MNETAELTDEEMLRLATLLRNDIDEFCAKLYGDDEHRWHLGASVIGDECSRKLWLGFRWFKREAFSGRMERLFNRGHELEPRWQAWLDGIGFRIWTLHPETQEQFRMSGVGGHYGGSLDGVGHFPERYAQVLDKIKSLGPVLCEFKSHNTKSFVNLCNKTLRIAKPQHFAQMSSYGKAYGYRYGVYFAINKNDDDIYIEVVRLDFRLAEQNEAKAEALIRSPTPPPRIAQSPAYFACKYCVFQGLCFNGERGDVNCRTCAHSEPTANGDWYCKFHAGTIPRDFVAKGCPSHLLINTN
jgi:hypothetical protein